MNKCIASLLLCAGVLCAGDLIAEESNEKTIVTLKDPSHPARITSQLMIGSITVHGADVKDITVETHGHGRIHRDDVPSERPDGLKRLDIPGGSGVEVAENNNVVNIRTNGLSMAGDLSLTVPRRSNLQLKSMSGEISVAGVEGEIDVNTMSGKIVLRDVSGSVVAHALNGAVLVALDRADPSKPMSFSTMNGAIDVTLPGSVKANLSVKVDNGDVFTDFDVKASSQSAMQEDGGPFGSGIRRHLRLDRTFHGTINGGGSELQFTSFNGQIYIRRKK